MNAGSQLPSGASRPLWVIAFALSVIAVCLLLFLLREPFQPKETAEILSPESISQKNAPDLKKPVANAHPRPLIRSIHSAPAATVTGSVVEAELADSSPDNAEPVTNLPAGAATVQQRGGYAPLTGQTASGFGEISGKVVLHGTPPPEITIQLDAVCGKLHATPVTTRHYVTGTNGGLANVFVYLKQGLEGRRFTPPKEAPVLDQVDCLYSPYVLGVMINQNVLIRNSDALLHNVHGTPKVNREFNFAQVRRGQVDERSFSRPEVLVRFKCDVHPWMFAYVGVVEHPFFAVTDKAGNFVITNVPPGDYVLEAYHLKTHGANSGLTQQVAVRTGEAAVADFTLICAPSRGFLGQPKKLLLPFVTAFSPPSSSNVRFNRHCGSSKRRQVGVV